ncbi:hypothetical protein [Flammeovirga sp. SJP92]|uniref:hypothetical protein n=1 Tax=Flammeovirga sp. SJP92 TaxID=1775430 RepID=UPI000786E34F|nr:hypothetical protein [Flammeovirga sp. SJP92]KXX67797.1 hypothetical protein AVL50_25380 [Flammeovirga sp. SJP92]
MNKFQILSSIFYLITLSLFAQEGEIDRKNINIEEMPYVHLQWGQTIYQDVKVLDSIPVIYIEQYAKKSKEVTFYFEDKFHQPVGQIKRTMVNGRNYLVIDATKLFFLVRGNEYYLKVKNKYGVIANLHFYYKKKAAPLTIHSKLQPVVMNCEEYKKSIFNLTMEITGGEPPYNITHKISRDKEGNELIVKPVQYYKKENSPSTYIEVEAFEGFYIKSTVTDNCKETKEYKVFTDCRQTGTIEFELNFVNPFNQNSNFNQTKTDY